jgi:GGDEF domain-containing protein
MSVCGENGAELPKRSLTRVMDNLGELIRTSLRKGDIASRCSVSQYIIMLPQSNYENSCMVMERIVKAFCRQYPHSPAELKYAVQPLEPNA